MGLPFKFDFKNPDYVQVFEWRLENLRKLREATKKDSDALVKIKQYYDDHTAQFITDWGTTFDPRNADIGLPPVIPFVLTPKQEDFVDEFEYCWKNRQDLLLEKTRGTGASTELSAIFTKHCLFRDNLAFGMGSYQEPLVDKIGDPRALLYKVRQFIELLPVEFRGTWTAKKNSAFMRIDFPETGSTITGAIGDNMFRGGRYSAILIDEAAHLLHDDAVEQAVSGATNCRVWASTPRGNSNRFARKRHGGKIRVFRMHWSDDPRYDEIWYKKECDRFDDDVLIAQELDINYAASVEGIIIPAEWVEAAIDAHIILKVDVSGQPRWGALDVADEGRDKNAYVSGQGILIDYVEQWSGKDSDIYYTVEHAAELAEMLQDEYIHYDADGLGAGVRGDARVVNEKRAQSGWRPIEFIPFRGSGEVDSPEEEVFPLRPGDDPGKYIARKNKDYFENAKAQEWHKMRQRFKNTYRAVKEGVEFDPQNIISISSTAANYLKLQRELSQPVRKYSKNNKLMVDKTPDGMPSPNFADGAMMRFAKVVTRPLGIFDVL